MRLAAPLALVAVVVAAWAAANAPARTLHYLVTVEVSGPGRVTGTGNGGTIDCPNVSCEAHILGGTTLVLAARPDGGATFNGWGGDCGGGGETCTLVMTGGQGKDTGGKQVSAGFNQAPPAPPPPPPMKALTVKKTGTGSGYVGGAGGIDCGPTCSISYLDNTQVTLLAVPDDGSAFAGWTGGGCGQADQCTVTLANDTEVTAQFDHVDRAPPVLKTIAGQAARGTTASLRFRVFDDSRQSRETLTIFEGSRQIGRVVVPLGHVVYRQVYSAPWQVPRTAAVGKHLFCAVASDSAGNNSTRSCSALRII